jgi:hypothetical protein
VNCSGQFIGCDSGLDAGGCGSILLNVNISGLFVGCGGKGWVQLAEGVRY